MNNTPEFRALYNLSLLDGFKMYKEGDIIVIEAEGSKYYGSYNHALEEVCVNAYLHIQSHIMAKQLVAQAKIVL